MASPKKDKTLSALEAVHTALKNLTPQERQRVLDSLHALLEIAPPPICTKADTATDPMVISAQKNPVSPTTPTTRPLAIRELIQDKKPRSHPQLITLFAYFRERHENRPSFARGDLEAYYKSSRENPPANFDRDFVNAVKEGWLHEDGESSYITSKGIEAVESGFAGGDRQLKKGRTIRKQTKPKTSKKRA